MSEQTNHLNHSMWDCKYHVVFTPKYRKKLLYGHLRGELREVCTVCHARKNARSSRGI